MHARAEELRSPQHVFGQAERQLRLLVADMKTRYEHRDSDYGSRQLNADLVVDAFSAALTAPG